MNIISNNEPLMKFVFMKSDLITKREREKDREKRSVWTHDRTHGAFAAHSVAHPPPLTIKVLFIGKFLSSYV
jgi:hypothetical protein